MVLYKVKKGQKFYVADPSKGLVTYSLNEFKSHWISTSSKGKDKGIAMFLETTPYFFRHDTNRKDDKERQSFGFLFGYAKKSSPVAKIYFVLICFAGKPNLSGEYIS